jgi:uncharacterized membrane protein YbjE (DUF340 family)
MWIIIVALLAGCIWGASGFFPAAWVRWLELVMTITLFIMLAALGAQIGGNAELLENLSLLGWQAAVISILSIIGSVGLLWGVSRYFKLPAGKGDDA